MVDGSVINGAAVVEATSLDEGAVDVSFSDKFDILSVILFGDFF